MLNLSEGVRPRENLRDLDTPALCAFDNFSLQPTLSVTLCSLMPTLNMQYTDATWSIKQIRTRVIFTQETTKKISVRNSTGGIPVTLSAYLVKKLSLSWVILHHRKQPVTSLWQVWKSRLRESGDRGCLAPSPLRIAVARSSRASRGEQLSCERDVRAHAPPHSPLSLFSIVLVLYYILVPRTSTSTYIHIVLCTSAVHLHILRVQNYLPSKACARMPQVNSTAALALPCTM